MTVEQLIIELNHYPMDAEVVIDECGTCEERPVYESHMYLKSEKKVVIR